MGVHLQTVHANTGRSAHNICHFFATCSTLHLNLYQIQPQTIYQQSIKLYHTECNYTGPSL